MVGLTSPFAFISSNGDSCPQAPPSAGQGAVCALQDAVILANCLYDLESLDRDAVQEAFLDFKEQRYNHVSEMYGKSKVGAIILYGQV